ncbi:MAG: phage tail protein [Erythrobacter sp.]|nr:phage tail protein [Erythrobacter sp.]
MASRPTSRELMTLGMFIFGMDTIPYQDLQRSREWRHEMSDRHGALPASQYVGPGPDSVTLAGLIVPELGARYSSIETLAEMAKAGDTYPLIDGNGRILGQYRIVRMEETHLSILAGGIPRHVGFRVELQRGDDRAASEPAQ